MDNGLPIYVGTEIKLSIELEPVDEQMSIDNNNIELEEIEIFCCPKKILLIKKEDERIKKLKDGNYLVVIDTASIGPGIIQCLVDVIIRDNDFADCKRKEILFTNTGIPVIDPKRP